MNFVLVFIDYYFVICSFPGGQISPEDKTIEETALREMQEEIGVDSSSVTVWGKLCQLPSKV